MKLGKIFLLFVLVIMLSSFISADDLSECKTECGVEYSIQLINCNDDPDPQTCVIDCQIDLVNCYDLCEVTYGENTTLPEDPQGEPSGDPQGEPSGDPQGEPKDLGDGFSISGDLFDKNIYMTPFIFGVLKDNVGNNLELDKDYTFNDPKFKDSSENKNYTLSQKTYNNDLFIFYIKNSSQNIYNNSYLGNYNNSYNFNMVFNSVDYGNKDFAFWFELKK
ncbi:MAG: hypothetical protein WCY27_00540 [archaeon]|nr:hypothetical protein [archaeon]